MRTREDIYIKQEREREREIYGERERERERCVYFTQSEKIRPTGVRPSPVGYTARINPVFSEVGNSDTHWHSGTVTQWYRGTVTQ